MPTRNRESESFMICSAKWENMFTSILISIANDGAWIGGGAIILPGVTIWKNSVIGAGSIVTHSIPDNCVAVGNPCRVIKQIDNEVV